MYELKNIYLGNNLDYIRQFPDNYFDLAIDDPPYGIGNVWSKWSNTRREKKDYHGFDNSKTPDSIYFHELKRVSKNQIIFGFNYFSQLMKPTNNIIIWDKLTDCKQRSMVELAWTSFKIPARIYRVLWNGAIKHEKGARIHPNQKPVQLYKKLLKDFCMPGDKVLDPHMGSGSSLIASIEMPELNLEYYGCEISPIYYNKILRRINEHQPSFNFYV